MSTNATRTKYLRSMRKSLAARMEIYDALPPADREFLANLPVSLWYSGRGPISAAERQTALNAYYASIEDFWGPDHPAVIDAKRRVSKRREGLVTLATPELLDELLS